MVKALTVVMLLAASAAIAAAHPGLLSKGVISINHGAFTGNSSDADSGNTTTSMVMPRIASWAARRADGDNATDSAPAPSTKTIKLAHGLITINIAHQQAIVADTNGTATKTISLAGLFNHGDVSTSASGNETGPQTISLHQILAHIANHGGAAAAAAAGSNDNATAVVKTITLPSIFSHIATATAGSSNGGDSGNATAITFPHPLSSLLSKHMSAGASSNETGGSMAPQMFRRAAGDDNSTAMPAAHTKTISISIGHGGVASSSGDGNSTGHIFSHGRRLNTLGHIIKAASGDANSTMGSSSGAKGSKSINISINKGRSMGGNSSDSDSDSGNTTARTAAHGVSLRIGGGCSCTKDCQPATRKVCKEVRKEVTSCSDVTSYEVGMSCTKKCFDPSKIMAIAHGRRRLLSANSANTIPHIAHSIAKSVIVGGNGTDGSSGSGDMGSGNRTAGGASSGSAEICKEICKPSVTPVTKMVCKKTQVVDLVDCRDEVVGITCTPRCSCTSNGGNGGNNILSSILAHHGH